MVSGPCGSAFTFLPVFLEHLYLYIRSLQLPPFSVHRCLQEQKLHMAPSQVLLSPAELSYLHTSLTSTPPIRPDARSAAQFRPLVAETDILPAANGSARICFADGTEAVVGVKAEVHKSSSATNVSGETEQEGSRGLGTGGGDADVDMDDDEGGATLGDENAGKGSDSWLEVTVEIPGLRDDDQMPVSFGSMLSEALLADGKLRDRLYINNRFHWMLYIDVSTMVCKRNCAMLTHHRFFSYRRHYHTHFRYFP